MELPLDLPGRETQYQVLQDVKNLTLGAWSAGKG